MSDRWGVCALSGYLARWTNEWEQLREELRKLRQAVLSGRIRLPPEWCQPTTPPVKIRSWPRSGAESNEGKKASGESKHCGPDNPGPDAGS